MYLKLTFIFAQGKIATCFLANCLKVAAIAGFSSDTAFAHTPIMAHTDWIGIHFSVFAVVRQSEMSLTHCLIYFFTHCAIKTGLMANSLSTMLWCIDLLGSKKTSRLLRWTLSSRHCDMSKILHFNNRQNLDVRQNTLPSKQRHDL